MHNPPQDLHNIKLNPQILTSPFLAHTNWHVITGAPCSGKTTIIELLASRGYQTAPEAGRIYFERELAKGRTIEEIRVDDSSVAPKINELQLEIEDQLQHDQPIFLDRGFPDCLSFHRLVGLDPNEVLSACFQHHYASVFILDRLPYQMDGVRQESGAASIFLDQCLFQDYTTLGYEVIRVPVLSAQDRVSFILQRLSL
jgi:predicted ATPase